MTTAGHQHIRPYPKLHGRSYPDKWLTRSILRHRTESSETGDASKTSVAAEQLIPTYTAYGYLEPGFSGCLSDKI